MEPEVELEVERVCESLREVIRRKKSSLRNVEQALGQGRGYMSQLLGGNVDIKLKHVFSVLSVIGVEPDEFFMNVYSRSDPVAAVRGLVSRAELDEIKSRISELENRNATASQRSTERSTERSK
jgi:transcriptional regulator with XRE-family HTH domain